MHFPTRTLRLSALLATLLAAPMLWAQTVTKFDLPQQSLATSLRAVGSQTGTNVLFDPPLVEGRDAPALKAQLTADEAFARLLAGSGIKHKFLDEKTVMLVTQPATAVGESSSQAVEPATQKTLRLVQVPEARIARASQDTVAEGVVDEEEKPAAKTVLPDVTDLIVTGRRIEGLNNKGLLQSGENSALYHDVYTAEDIERFGISSIEELFRLIPQTSSASTSLQAPSESVGVTGGLTLRTSTVGLRGFSSTQTVVLVNGRALPRSGTGAGADISRIPIAAIERVEVLPYAGSAIYGAGALGGAINIILRKEYSGHDLNTYVGTTTEGGGSELRVTYLGGFNFNQGRTTLTTTASYAHRDALRGEDRDYLDRALDRYGPASTVTNAQGVRLFETLILPSFAGAPGTILVGNAPSAALNSLGIPGAPSARYAAIPAGLTAAQTATLTPASFAATAGTANLQPRYGRSVLYEPVDSYSVNAQLEHSLIQDRLQVYGEFTLGYNRRNYSAPQNFVIQLSATDPLNPFRNDVTAGFAGRPISIFMDTPDLPDPSNVFEYNSARAVVGLKGRISDNWEWSTDGVFDYAYSTLNSNNPISNLVELTKLSPFSSTPAGQAAPAVRRAIYPVFADHTVNPLAAGDIDTYFDSIRYSTSKSKQWEGNARVLGTIFNLPAGPLQTSALGKYQNWDFASGQLLGGSNAYSQLINGTPLVDTPSRTPVRRKVLQGAVELSIPIISRLWRPIPIESFEIQASYSRENNTSSSVSSEGPFEYKQSATNGVLAGRLQLTRDIAFRASYSEGFYPPDWSAVGLPISTQMLPGFFPDPARGNTLQFFSPGAPIMTILQGGNPGLQPETADSKNFGLMFTPRFAPGFSMNVDFWRIEKVDAIVFSSFVSIIANPDAYGFLITRTEPTAQDIAQGWLGFITQVDARAFNAAVTRTEGTDVKLRYSLDTASTGSFEFNLGGSFVNNFQLLATPNSPEINTAGGSGPIRRRGHGAVTWNRNNWFTTVTGRYTGPRSTNTTAPTSSFPGAFPLDGSRLPSSMLWDLQVAYDLPYDGAGSKGWMSGTRLTLGVLNLLNEEPTFVSSSGSGFYNGAEDPRQRVVYFQVKKSF